MGEITPSLAAETKAVKEAYAALNRNDVPGFLQIFAPDVVRIEPPGFPASGTFHGIEALKAILVLNRGKWAEGSCEPERFVVAGDRVVVFVHVHVRLEHETEWREGDIADGFAFRNGKAIHFQTFVDSGEALEWAGAAKSEKE